MIGQERIHDAADIGRLKALLFEINVLALYQGRDDRSVSRRPTDTILFERFDQAITTVTPTKGKNKGNPDPDILNAVGRANAGSAATL